MAVTETSQNIALFITGRQEGDTQHNTSSNSFYIPSTYVDTFIIITELLDLSIPLFSQKHFERNVFMLSTLEF